mgnify:CR=1 FL=1
MPRFYCPTPLSTGQPLSLPAGAARHVQVLRLQPGDVIMIPPAGPRMALVGATDHGAIYELKSGSKVKDVLALGLRQRKCLRRANAVW